MEFTRLHIIAALLLSVVAAFLVQTIDFSRPSRRVDDVTGRKKKM